MTTTIVTHSGDFHPDEVCAIAALRLYLGTDTPLTIIRTRDPAHIKTADWVIDVGGVYEPSARRFDHHQIGAPVRENGLPYAAFGLIWREIGADICGGPAIAEILERTIVQPVDAGDTGVALYTLNEYNIAPFEFYQIIESFHEPGDGHTTIDEMFEQAVCFARDLIQRLINMEIKREQLRLDAQALYEKQNPKDGIIVAEHPISTSAFRQFLDVLVIVKPRTGEDDTNWMAKVVAKDGVQFSNRALFPEDWAGLRDQELADKSGITDAIFCHSARFIFVAKSQAGALAAAQQVIPTA